MEQIFLISLCCSVVLILAFMLVGRLLSGIRNWMINKTGSWIIYITMLGVVHHELSHFIMALLSGAKVQSVVLFRTKPKDGNIGEVTFTPRGWNVVQSIQVVLTSVAPMLFGFFSLYLLVAKVNPIVTGSVQALFYYLEFSIFLNMSLSKQDFKNILTRLGWLIIVLTLLFMLIFGSLGVSTPSAVTVLVNNYMEGHYDRALQ